MNVLRTESTSEVFFLCVCAVVGLLLVIWAGNEHAASSLRQQGLQLTAEQIQQGLDHLRTQAVRIRPARRQQRTIQCSGTLLSL